jgi:cutinase
MKLSVSVLTSLLVALASSSPVTLQEFHEIEARKSYGTTSNEYNTNGCNDVIMFFARGSTQDGNIVSRALSYQCP